MRDIALLLVVAGFIPYILIKPQVGVYVWSWLSYMNPHRFTYGFAYSFPFAQSVAIATFMGLFFWRQPKRIPMTRLTVLWLVFLSWLFITTVFAMLPELAWLQYEKVMKVQLITFLTIMLIRTKNEINVFVWVIALSLGFFGIKGGIFTLQTLGSLRVWGPPGSYIEDNNALAVALLMVLPLFYYLRLQEKRAVIRHLLVVAMLLIAVSVVGSQSRGALVAICIVGFFLWLKLPRKIISGAFIITLFILIFTFMPDSWHERMDTIVNYQDDGSAMGRITTWEMTINLANDRIFGGGLNLWSEIVDRLYMSNPDNIGGRAAHSIYFSVLGEHGWIGLIIFLAIFFIAWRDTAHILRRTKNDESMKWLNTLTRMIQVSLIAYLSGGAFLSLSYFDLPWHLLAIVVVTKQLLNEKIKSESPNQYLYHQEAKS